MTVEQLICRLEESGDEKFRKVSEVRILDGSGVVIDDDIDMFNVKSGVNSVDIYTNYHLEIGDEEDD